MNKTSLIRITAAALLSTSAVLGVVAPSHAKGGKLPRIAGIVTSRPAGQPARWARG